jgi:ABC-type nitrate/sulfonate/bicarbonate transport system substrate-binding protein
MKDHANYCSLFLLRLHLLASAPLVASAAGAEVCSATGTCSDKVQQKIRLSLEWFTNPDHMPLIIAKQKGFFSDHGLDVEIIEPDDHFDPLVKIKTGELDVAVTESIHLAQDRAKGEPVIGFGRFLHTDGGVMFLESSGIKRPRDMCQLREGGRKTRVQYPGAPGLGGLAIVKTMAEADGASCDIDAVLEPVNEGFYHTNALKEGKADVATLIFYNFEMVEANHMGLNASFFSLKHWGVPDFCQLVFITTRDHFIVKKEELRHLNMAVRKAIDWIKMHTSEAKQIYNEWTGSNSTDAMSDAILDATLLMFPNEQSMSFDYYDNLEAWLQKTGQIANSIGAHDYWTNELAL